MGSRADTSSQAERKCCKVEDPGRQGLAERVVLHLYTDKPAQLLGSETDRETQDFSARN